MVENKTIDELHEEIVQWEKTKSYLNREISAVENSTKNIVNWMQDNTKKIQHSYFAIEDALYQKDEVALKLAFEESGDVIGLVIKMPTKDGRIILDAAREVFNKHQNNPILSELAAIKDDFPSHLMVKEGDLVKEDSEEKVENNDEAVVVEVEEPKKHWWELQSSIDNKKKESLHEQLQMVRDEVVGLQTEKPFYVDSFFEWVDAVQTAREDVPGDGEYIDFLRDTYRNPEFLLTQVYNDSNETLQVAYEDIHKKTVAYDAIKSAFSHKDVEELSRVLEEHKENEKIIHQLLEEENHLSLSLWALNVFPEGNIRTEAYKEVLEAMPLDLIKGREETTGQEIYNKISKQVLSRKLQPEALLYNINAANKILEDNGIIDNIHQYLKRYSNEIMPQSIEDSEWAKHTLHTIFKIIDNDTDAIDFYVDMFVALKEEKTNKVKNLLDKADKNTLEQWLLLRDVLEYNNGTRNVMTEIINIAKTDNGRASLFKSAISAGIPPVSIKDSVSMHQVLKDNMLTSLQSDKTSNFEIFKGTLDFVEVNTNKEEFAEILTATSIYDNKYSLMEIILDNAELSVRDKYFNVLFEKVETNVEVADILYTVAQTAYSSKNTDILMSMSDEMVGEFIEIDTEKASTVIYPERLAHMYHAYGSLGYFSGSRRDQGETEISDKDTQTFINIIGEREGIIKIDDNLINPQYWDVICYNEISEEIEFLKNNKERVVFSLGAEESSLVLEEISKLCVDTINIQNTVILDPYNFETLRYDEDVQELIIDQNIVFPNVLKTEFTSILEQISNRNKDILHVKKENLILNIRSIDGVYKRSLESYIENDDNGEEWEQFIADILINGRSVCIKDLFKEKEYSIDTEIQDLQKQEDAVVFSILEKLEKQDDFETVTEEISINTKNMVLVRSYEDQTITLATDKDKYALEDVSGESLEWINHDKLINAPFIDKENGEFTFRIFDEDVVLNKKDINNVAVSRIQTPVLKDFLCNAEDICEVSIDKIKAEIVLKTGRESVSLEIEEKDIPKIVKKLGLENTILGKRKIGIEQKIEEVSALGRGFNKSAGNKTREILDFFAYSNDNNDNKISNIEKIKAYSISKLVKQQNPHKVSM